MLRRNLLRLHANFHAPATTPANFDATSWMQKRAPNVNAVSIVALATAAAALGAVAVLARR